MTILDRFRRRPDWEHEDPQIRAEAVRRLTRHEHELLVSIARSDDAPRVRRAAVHKLDEPDVLTELARSDSDAGVRDEALEGLLRLACQAEDETAALSALQALVDARHLVGVVRDARLESVRRAAFERLPDPRTRATVAKTASDPGLRRAAVEQLSEAESLHDVALKGDHKDAALAALDRIDDPGLLEELASHSRQKAVARRARARLAERQAAESAAAESSSAAESLATTAVQPAVAAPDDVSATSSQGPMEFAAPTQPAAAVSASDSVPAAPPQAAPPDSAAPTPVSTPTAVVEIAAEASATPLVAAPAEQTAEPGRAASEATVARSEPPAASSAVAPIPDAPAAEPEPADAVAAATRLPEAVDPTLQPSAASPTAEPVAAEASAVSSADPADAVAEPATPPDDSPDRSARLERLCATLESVADAQSLDAAARDRLDAAWREWDALAAAGPVDSALEARAAAARTRREAVAVAERAAAEQQARDNLARLEALAERLEALVAADTIELRDAEHAMREAREALHDPGPLPHRRDRERLAERIRAGRSGLFPRAQELREADEWTRWANVAIQEELCSRVEALRDNEDLAAVARELREVDARWKQARLVPKEEAAALWDRFRAAREPLRERVGGYYARQSAERKANLAAKLALCEQAEGLKDSTDWVATAQKLQALQNEWKTIGPIPRKHSDAVWKRFRAACQSFFERRKGDLDDKKKTWAENLARKEALCERAEALAESSDWDATAAELKSLQAEWKAIGPVRRNRSEAVWKRFRTACDAFFERYKNRDQLERAAAAEAREALLAEIEALQAEPPEDLGARVISVTSRWREAPNPGGDLGRQLEQRLHAVRDALVAAHPERFVGTELDPAAARGRRKKLLAQVEAMVPAEPKLDDLAGRLKEALASNTLGGAAAAEGRRKAALAEVESARKAWRRLAPAVVEEDRELARRFEDACRRIVAHNQA